jgi:hypothetical protein
MRHIALVAALLCAGCATVPLDLNNGGVPLAKTGWQLSGGADFDRKMWYVLFWKPWGKQERDAAEMADKIILPE